MGDFERVKETVSLKAYAEDNLEPAHGGLVCPCCKSGTGPNHSPAFKISQDGKQWKCFSCGEGGDIFDLAGILNNTDDKAEQLQIVAQWAGVTLDSFTSTGGSFRERRTNWASIPAADGTAQDGNAGQEETRAAEPDYSEGRAKHRQYIADCAARYRDAYEGRTPTDEAFTKVHAYLQARGFTPQEVISLGIGYDPKPAHGWQRKDETTWINGPRIVIPWRGCDYYHVDRATDEHAKELKYDKPKADEVGPQPLYNPEAANNDVFFLVEGVLDALAIELATGLPVIAVASNNLSHANAEEIAALLKGRDCLPVVMLDADGPGKDGAQRLVKRLDEGGIWHMSADDVPGAKDAAELFAEDRAALASFVKGQYETALDTREKLVEERRDSVRGAFNLEDAAKVASEIFNCEGWQEPISTGFNKLDSALNGGLRTGLTMLGAVSSAGKTTLLIQVADYIAAHGWPVLFVSIEQSARELVSKSLSRLMAQRGYRGVTLYEMGNRLYRPYKAPGKEDALTNAYAEYYCSIAPNLCILSADRDAPDVYAIKGAAEFMRGEDEQNRPPVVILDYLQLIKPPDKRMTDKQAIDTTVSTLRRIAKELKTPVVAISSLNRASYNGAIDLDSFKESGSIEYSADVLLGLQPLGIREYSTAPGKSGGTPSESQIAFKAREKIEAFKHQNPRKCEIVILKNRTGALPDSPLPFTFYPESSLFIEG